jgi:Predicted nucleoside-diphosphate-sugar epimerases
MRIALLGSTGLVGRNVVQLLARLDEVESVYCPVRSIPNLGQMGVLQGASKFKFNVIDFSDLQSLNFSGCDAVMCCLGTTRKQAGSRSAQEKVDVRLPLTLAAIAKKQGVPHFLCVSAQGANSHSSFFYNRLKGMLEEGLTMMNFNALTLVRPSLLLGKHKDKRFGEELLQKVFGAHPEWIPERLRPVHAETVAAHLVASLLKPPTEHVCASDGVKGKRIIYNRVLAQTKVEELF